jgi:general secretion pathway protein N
MIDRLALFLLVAGCLVFGGILFVELAPAGKEDVTVAQAATRPDVAPALRRQQNLRVDELLAAILARPLFNSTRRPPQNAPSEATGSDLSDARLTGIVTEPGRKIAIFAVNGEKPLRVAEGDAVSGWRIESITPREVSLSGPSGTKILQPKLDPNLAPPSGQPPTGNIAGRFPTPAAAAAAVGRPPAPGAAAGVGQPNPVVPVGAPGVPPRPARPRQQR